MKKPSCEKCRFFDAGGPSCRRYAPKPQRVFDQIQHYQFMRQTGGLGFVEAPAELNEAHWPWVSPDDWCGEFQAPEAAE